MLNRMKIVTRLASGFSLMLLGVLVLGVMGAASLAPPWLIAVMLVMILIGGIAVAFLVTRSIRQSLEVAVVAVKSLIKDSTDKVRAAQAVGAGDLGREIVVSEPLQIDLDSLPRDELGVLMKTALNLSEIQCALDEAFLHMTQSLRLAREAEQGRDWLKTGRNELNLLIRDEQSTAGMADQVLGFLVTHLKAGVGALYLFDERAVKLVLAATYAVTKDMKPGEQFRLGEGVIGQAAREQKIICLADVPPGYLPIGSALGESAPKVVVAIPLLHGNRLVGVIEIGSFREFSATELQFVELAREAIAIAIDANLAHQRTAELLEQTEQQSEELRVQQEELQQSNEELAERARMLEQQRENIRLKSQEIEAASQILQEKVAELERVSTYKSEFLANMSHELRTPLNSLMILSSLLKQNKDGNLSAKQVEFASTINSAGMDLLNLINDILDLSKVEAGQMQFNFAALPVPDLCDSMRATFEPLAEQKGLAFRVEADAGIPTMFHGDEQRVHQIIKNLLSNALKFTENGEVSLRIATPAEQENPLPAPALAFVVSDTGIGIPAAKQQLVFEAFQQ
ncbi:MAG: histidine kinase dimerization/phospho-acceptor domain-containing protein, partial [Rhodocyclaceae bacterium]|nr:histidine kinase dimerization/phospho-acceptor domain-containing protein [Rhodocyclaceae bacterium]